MCKTQRLFLSFMDLADPLTQSYSKYNQNLPCSCTVLSLTHWVQDPSSQPLSHQPFTTPCTPLLPHHLCLHCADPMQEIHVQQMGESITSAPRFFFGEAKDELILNPSVRNIIMWKLISKVRSRKPLCINNSTCIQQPD